MLPAGNLRRPETWEAFFQADRKAEVKSSKSLQSLGRRAPSRDLSQPKRTPSADRMPPSVFSSPPATAPHRARSPKAVKHIPPLKVEEDTPVPTSLPPSPVKTRTSSVPLRPHTARSRAVYEGPPGPGAYAPETKIEALSTVKSQQSFGFAGPLAGVDRRKTGPFGRAFAAGSAPGPGQYLSQDHETPRPQSSAPTSFGLADRSTFARKQCDPFVKPQLDPMATPGPGQYKMEDEERIQALDASLKSAAAKSPGTVGTRFTFASTSSSRIKYASSRIKTPAAATIGSTEDRSSTGPFGKFELNSIGAANPSPCDYDQKTTLKISGTLDSPVKSAIPASPNSCLGGTGERSNPMGRMSLYDPKWMPVPTFSNAPNTAPGCYDKAAVPSFGKQTVSTKQSSAALSFPSEGRDTRYKYLQPEFKGADKPFYVPPPGAYNVRESAAAVTGAAKAMKFGTSGRSAVGITYA